MRRILHTGIGLLLILSLAACASVRSADGMQVVSMSRYIDMSQPDHAICGSLALTRGDVATYFSLAEKLDASAFHDEAMILPCSYRGAIRIAGHLYQWQIFAGGAAYLYDGAGANLRYLCRGKCLAALPGLR
jgi:hypothetical protein